MQTSFKNSNSVLRKFSWNMLEKYSERAHQYCDIDPLIKAIKVGSSNLRQDEIEKFLKCQQDKARTPYIRKNFEEAISLLRA